MTFFKGQISNSLVLQDPVEWTVSRMIDTPHADRHVLPNPPLLSEALCSDTIRQLPDLASD